MIILALGIIIGFLLGLVATPTVEAVREWRAKRRKFFCDGCKTRRRLSSGYQPLSLDLEYGTDDLIPLNLLLCKNCAPHA